MLNLSGFGIRGAFGFSGINSGSWKELSLAETIGKLVACI